MSEPTPSDATVGFREEQAEAAGAADEPMSGVELRRPGRRDAGAVVDQSAGVDEDPPPTIREMEE
jgi:hypothetical protein